LPKRDRQSERPFGEAEDRRRQVAVRVVDLHARLIEVLHQALAAGRVEPVIEAARVITAAAW